jgi:hypothetical protein
MPDASAQLRLLEGREGGARGGGADDGVVDLISSDDE